LASLSAERDIDEARAAEGEHRISEVEAGRMAMAPAEQAIARRTSACVKASVSAAAEQELTQAALFYAQQASAELGRALIAEFERGVDLLHDAELRIVALAHQRRKPGYWRGRS
jgi:hypothetical protein